MSTRIKAQVSEMSDDELRQAIELRKEQIAEWNQLVKQFGEKLKVLEKEYDSLAAEELHHLNEVQAKKCALAVEMSKVAQVDSEIKAAKEEIDVAVQDKMEFEQQASTLKVTLQNLILAENSMETQAKAKEEALANEFMPLFSELTAQEKVLNEEIILMRQEVEQDKELVENQRTKEKSAEIEIRRYKDQLAEAETDLRDLKMTQKERQEEFERRRQDLNNEIGKTEKKLQDSELLVRDKVFAVAEVNRELEKLIKEEATSKANNDSISNEIHNERNQIRNLQVSIQDVESKRQTEAAKLIALKKELEDANKKFKIKSKELTEMTEKEQRASLSYCEEMEKEFEELQNETEFHRKQGKSSKRADPELESLKNEVEQKMEEIKNAELELEKQLEEIRNAHFKRKAQIEVANARNFAEQRLCNEYTKEKAELERKTAENDLHLSETTKFLAGLKAEVSTHVSHITPEVWKQREAFEDDEGFEEVLNKQVKEQELNAQMNETKLKVLEKQSAEMDAKMRQLHDQCEAMKQQLQPSLAPQAPADK